MTAMPPEPGFSADAGPGLPPQPPAYPQGRLLLII